MSVYLLDTARLALGLVGPSVRSRDEVQAAQDAYAAANGGAWFYVDGMSNKPTPVPTTLTTAGTGSLSGNPGGSGSGVSSPAPLTVSVTKAASSKADETVEVTFAGGPSIKEQVVTWSFTSSAGQTPQNPVTIPIAHTAESAAKLLQAAETDTDLTSAVNGAVVTFTPKAGESITGLNISIS